MNKTRSIGLIFVSLLLLSFCACSGPSFPYNTYISDPVSYRLTLKDDNTYTFAAVDGGNTTGTFSVKGDELTWETDSYCDALNAGTATYTWTFEDDIFLLKVKGEDKCPDRLAVLDNIPYYLEK